MINSLDITNTVLNNHLCFPDLSDDSELERLYSFMSSSANRAEKEKILNKFIRQLALKLKDQEQIDFFLKAATEYYTFIKRDGLFFPPIWFLCRAFKINQHSKIEEQLTQWERDLLTHPFIQTLQREAITNKVNSLNRLLQNNREEYQNKFEEFFQMAQALTSQGRHDLARLIYDAISALLRNVRTDTVPFEKRKSDLARVENEYKQNLAVSCKWRYFHEKFQKLKASAQTPQAFSKGMRDLLQEIFRYCHEMLLYLKPCEYEVLIIGSLTREEMTSCSDFECAFLIAENDKRELFIKNYLSLFLAFIRFYMGCLDDAWVVTSDNFLILRQGCDLDEDTIKYLIGGNHGTFSEISFSAN